MSSRTDIAIIGAGPAGLSAAIWSARYLHSTVVIDSGDPRNWETRTINGYLGLPNITPSELRAIGRSEAERAGAHFIDGTVATVTRESDDHFTIALERGMSVTAARILLAIGVRDVWPDVPGLDRCYGATAHVCPDCDGYDSRGKKIVVIGNGKKATSMALALATWTSKIVICTNGEPADFTEDWLTKLTALDIPILESRITRAHSVHGQLTNLDLEEGVALDCDHIFFSIGQTASDDLAAQLGCTRDEIGRVITDEHYQTSVQHVYAAGDIIHGTQLSIAAASSGAVAAVAMHHSLLPSGRLPL